MVKQLQQVVFSYSNSYTKLFHLIQRATFPQYLLFFCLKYLLFKESFLDHYHLKTDMTNLHLFEMTQNRFFNNFGLFASRNDPKKKLS